MDGRKSAGARSRRRRSLPAQRGRPEQVLSLRLPAAAQLELRESSRLPPLRTAKFSSAGLRPMPRVWPGSRAIELIEHS